MEQQNITTRKLIAIIFTIIFLFSLVGFLLNYTWLTVSYSGKNTAYVSIINPDDNTVYKSIELKQNDSQTLLVHRSDYKIDVNPGVGRNEFAQYRKSIGLIKDSLEVELQPQKSSVGLGTSDFGCSYQLENGSSLFYPCVDYRGTVEIDGEVIIDPLVEDIADHGHSHTITNEEPSEQNMPVGFVLKPYMGSFLSAVSDGKGSISLSLVDFNNKKFDKKAGSKIDGFGGQVKGNTVSVAQNKDSSIISVFDESKKEILIFSDINDSAPDRVGLSEELDNLGRTAQVQILAAPDTVNVVIKDVGEIEDHSHLGEGEPTGQDEVFGGVKQRAISVSVAESKISQVRNLPEKLLIRDVVSSPAGDLIILPTYTDEELIFLPVKNGGGDIDIFQKGVATACWKDENSLYYIDSSTSSIFMYSTSKRASFLVYTYSLGAINGLRCDNGQITISTSSSRDENTFFYRILDKDLKGTRLESVLPLFFDPTPPGAFLSDVDLKASVIGPNQIGVELVYPGGRKPAKELTERYLLNDLREKGVETKDLKFKFNF